MYAAYEDVRRKKGAAGVDGKTIDDFEKQLEKNLYKIWNRMSSGSYFPKAVKQVEIPKKDSDSIRKLAHCKTEMQAKYVLNSIRKQLSAWGLELHPDKTKIVHCRKGGEPKKGVNEEFDFLGFTFRRRSSQNQKGQLFMGFLPAMSKRACKEKAERIRGWNLQRRSDLSLTDVAKMCNQEVRGWINYYATFYKSKLVTVLLPLNLKLIKWAMRKYKMSQYQARKKLVAVCRKHRQLFSHWEFGLVMS